MRYLKKLTIALLAITTIISCNNSEKKENNSYTIKVSGEENFPEGARVAVYRSKDVESPESVEILKKGVFVEGKFELKGEVNEVHTIVVDVIQPDSEKPYMRVTFPLEPGAINIHFTSQRTFDFKGGKYGEHLVNSWNTNSDYQKAFNALVNYKVTDYNDKAQRKESMSRMIKVNDLKQEILGDVFTNAQDPLLKLLVYDMGYWGDENVDMNDVIEGLVAEVGPEHRQSKVAMLSVKMRRETSLAQKSIGIGTVIKDFEAKDLQGKNFHLSNVLTKNKYVLVEFWASWCGPCRAEIPHMKKAYSHYKDKGFEIVSFTLDHNKEKWEEASNEDQIPWINTGDLLARTSPVVKLYGVKGVPANYLVEATSGKIIAMDLRGEKLDHKLEELLGK